MERENYTIMSFINVLFTKKYYRDLIEEGNMDTHGRDRK
jgi:hypothetical protein